MAIKLKVIEGDSGESKSMGELILISLNKKSFVLDLTLTVISVFAILFVFTALLISRYHQPDYSNVTKTVAVHVKSGDTIWRLASRYGDKDTYILIRIDEIARINRINPSEHLKVGKTILIPVTPEQNLSNDIKLANLSSTHNEN